VVSGGLLAVIAAAVTGLLGLVGGLLAGSQRSRAFSDEWARSRQDLVANSAVRLIQAIATKLARAGHAMWWLTWRAENEESRVTPNALDDFDWELHELLPQIVGAQAALRAMDSGAADKVDTAVEDLHRLCTAISVAIADMRRSGSAALLAQCLPDAVEYRNALTTAMKNAAGEIWASYGGGARSARAGKGARPL
jgi:hypothetical protein